jgi:phage terminase large subunit
MSADVPDISRAALRVFKGELIRSRTELVPAAFQFLWESPRFLVAYGGRASAKSWSIARVLLSLAHEGPLRLLCCREIQSSVRESALRLLADQVQLLELDDFFEIRADSIVGRNGSEFIFEGLRYNASRLRSLEGVDICWVEEAQSVSEMSWETLIPTIRKRGSRFFISYNPMGRDDPVGRRFVEKPPPGTVARKVSWRDNPYLTPEVEAERAWLERTDPDAYRHVWEGEPRTVSDALILRGKYAAEPFVASEAWAGPYHGLDYGFSRDPSAALRCYIDDATRTLYIDREYWQLGADIDALPGALEAAIPGISRHVLYADSARPESTSYLARNGIPSARSAEKWPGSVDDGIAYLRSFARIVIDPACKHLIDECGSYSFKTDRLTGVPLPEPVDANNHLIDALRYALSPLIRNQPTGGYFSRAALLLKGEPLECGTDRPTRIAITLATCDRPGAAIGAVMFAHFEHYGLPVQVLDYDIAEVGEALTPEWLSNLFARAQQLRAEWNALEELTSLWVDEGQLHETLLQAIFYAHSLGDGPCNLRYIRQDDNVPPTLDERAAWVRASVNAGKFVKLSRSAYARQLTFRSVTANHLVNQVLGYRPGAGEAPQELAAAFVLACAIAYVPGQADFAPDRPVPLEPAAAVAPPSPPPPEPGALAPGFHIVNGIGVHVPNPLGSFPPRPR